MLNRYLVRRYSRIALYALVLAFLAVGCGGGGGGGGGDTGTGGGSSTTTYGNVTLTDVWVDDEMTAGFENEMRFTAWAEAEKYNVYIRLTLIPLSGDLYDDGTEEVPVASYTIDTLAAGESQTVSYDFILPADIADGTYRAEFSVNAEDFFSDDDSLQGESDEDQEDNYVTYDSVVTIVTPDLPAMRAGYSSLDSNSVVLSSLGRASNRTTQELLSSPDMQLNQEFEAFAFDIIDPVEVEVSLKIPGLDPFLCRYCGRTPWVNLNWWTGTP